MPRSTPEWVGKTPDTPVPDHVKLRIFRDHGGRCHISGRKILPGDAWDLDHVIALINSGENRESNLAPALRDKHRQKTAEDVKAKAKGDRAEKRRVGIKAAPRVKMRGRQFTKTQPQHTATRPLVRKSERTTA